MLASASPARLGVLRAAGVEPAVIVSQVDEDAILAELGSDAAHEDAVTALARAKAHDVAARVTDDPSARARRTVIVGCDSMLSIGGALVGKPHTPAVARERWGAMRGRAGRLLTGHCVLLLDGDGAPPREATGTGGTTLRFGAPSDAEIDAYVATGEPLEVAGAFTLDGLGGWFIEGIDGDPSSVIGISLPLMRRLLSELGVGVVDLWRGVPDPA
ncbi:Nucleoside triphosphate pyrophosphatase OS=Tsukamurella paurometabola (strain ATCC 8368 / DSM/ CCUG 35730 / CIP 100753 / JCM 10117 / KCTC 9821 / NBRC 16120/ NCIMB 702349 / NCTC 13040) OX=521096 GN=Tpau_1041 PE=3 SV=1 [Tsukamurella paurometabola]|uniref:Nucleoside triphosphate pyrophosphatase n=1 Tax=Tsukamurella paurometabola (strain ATCC 8368 / DSM 20162 / CCUG 35730 / CIP 100753 / JCM 10117 / KCTC 9821 / NBRC 16120 / NCIMB 702349 / NCTC 13040) TaxID=521096 RepID=D5UV84_TSUPD|nr:Maf family protein [Tsukamurella paurometabola]ADG77674.1 maf protein [Tsukamurella paurometabola DSM 20162]SUP28240.1 Septum formation protein Maf [Tsukamurella paurometabola]